MKADGIWANIFRLGPRKESLAEILPKVISEEAPSPSVWNRATPPELEAICLKCLRKDPSKRYPSASAP